jgi:hypothetical protein
MTAPGQKRNAPAKHFDAIPSLPKLSIRDELKKLAGLGDREQMPRPTACRRDLTGEMQLMTEKRFRAASLIDSRSAGKTDRCTIRRGCRRRSGSRRRRGLSSRRRRWHNDSDRRPDLDS